MKVSYPLTKIQKEHNMFDILKDIKSGALPKDEILPFFVWMIGCRWKKLLAALIIAIVIWLAIR